MARGIRIQFPGAGPNFTSFNLTTTAASGTYPFSIGVGFKKGDVPDNVTTDLSTAQVVVKRRWNDGSAKHAIISGRALLTQNVARSVSISTGSQSSGTALTASDIQAAAPSAEVVFDSFGSPSLPTVSLSSLLASPVRTWIGGAEMVECHYRSDVGAGTLLSVWFHVRLFADGRIWVRVIVENGYLDNGAGAVAPNADRSYGVTISVGGSSVYSNTGSPGLTHYRNTRYSAEGWIGGNPAITPAHDVAYLRASKLVPNYWWRNPSSATLNGLTQTYTQMGRGDLTASMGQGGDQPGIGILPRWNALYMVGADARGYRATLANSSHLNSYGIVWRDKTTNLVVKPSAFPTWSLDGAGAGGTFNIPRGALTWEVNHLYGEGYLAYLLTGDYWHYETMLMNASVVWACTGSGTVGVTPRGNGTSRVMAAEIRGNAWGLRCYCMVAALCPTDDAVAAEYQTLVASSVNHWKGVADTAPNQLGYVYFYNALGNIGHGTSNSGYVALWMQNFWTAALGFGYDIEPLANMSNFASMLSFLYKGIVGIFGGDASGYYFTYAGAYNLKVAPANNNSVDPAIAFSTWATVFDATYGSSPPVTLANTLLNIEDNEAGDPIPMTGGSGDPAGDSVMRWDNLLPSIAYAHDHGATGAQAAWNRLVGATNWATFRDRALGLDQHPHWGVVPRGWAT